MKNLLTYLALAGLLISHFQVFSAFSSMQDSIHKVFPPQVPPPTLELKEEALEVLRTKCNVCHRKKNPFKIFSLKNMDKHAPKIYQQVFVYERMPKGDEIKLTGQEYQTLRTWLQSKNIL